MPLKGARESTHVPLHRFTNKLIAIVPHKLNVLAPWPKKVKDKETGEEVEVDAYQHHVTVIALESENRLTEDDVRVKYEVLDDNFVFLGASKVMRQVEDAGGPILGRLKKAKPNDFGAKPWILKDPTDEDWAIADSLQPKLDEAIDEAIAKFNARNDRPAPEARKAEVVEDDDADAPEAPF